MDCAHHEAPFWFLSNPNKLWRGNVVMWMIDDTRHPNPWIKTETKTIRGILAVRILLISFLSDFM